MSIDPGCTELEPTKPDHSRTHPHLVVGMSSFGVVEGLDRSLNVVADGVGFLRHMVYPDFVPEFPLELSDFGAGALKTFVRLVDLVVIVDEEWNAAWDRHLSLKIGWRSWW